MREKHSQSTQQEHQATGAPGSSVDLLPSFLRAVIWSNVVAGFFMVGLVGSLARRFRPGDLPLAIVLGACVMFGSMAPGRLRRSCTGTDDTAKRALTALLPYLVALASSGLGFALAYFVLPPSRISMQRVLVLDWVTLAIWALVNAAPRVGKAMLILTIIVLAMVDFMRGPALPPGWDPLRSASTKTTLVCLCAGITWIGAVALEIRQWVRCGQIRDEVPGR